MRKIPCALFLIFLSLFTNYLSAQDNSLEQVIGWRGNEVELHTITDKPKQQGCTFIVGTDSIRAIVTAKQLTIVQEFHFRRLPEEQILGGFFLEGRIFLFSKYYPLPQIHRWELDIATGKAIDKWLPFDMKNELVIDCISGGNHFLYFTADKNTSEFIIYDFSSSDDFTTWRYRFGAGVWKDLTKPGLFKRSVNVEKIDLEGECSLESAAQKNKLYLHNDTLLLVMNNQVDSTQVFSFDLKQKKVNSLLIKHGAGSLANGAAAHNSFLLNNALYYVRATTESILLEVADVYTGRTLKTFIAGKDDIISFKNTAVIQEGTVNSAKEVRELDKTWQLLQKMVNGEAIIIAAPHSNGQVQLTVGSYTKVIGGNRNTNYMHNPEIPNRMWIPLSAFRQNNWTKSARFKILLNENTYEQVGGAVDRSINERIDRFYDEVQLRPKAENLFKANGYYCYAFYDKTGRRLVILQF